MKNFIKPNFPKITLAILIFLNLPGFITLCGNPTGCFKSVTPLGGFILLLNPTRAFDTWFPEVHGIIFLILYLIIGYLLSCSTVFIIKQIGTKLNIKIKKDSFGSRVWKYAFGIILLLSPVFIFGYIGLLMHVSFYILVLAIYVIWLCIHWRYST
jgi:hypothetical protein